MKTKKLGISISLILAIIILMIPFTVSAAAGDRATPYYGFLSRTLTLQEYSWETPKTINIQLVESIKGAEANSIVNTENMFNQRPAADEEWILFKYHLKYIAGPDELLQASDVIWSGNAFFTNTGVAISPISTASFSGDKSGLSQYDVGMYPGGESDIWYGMLVKKTVGYPLYRVATGYDNEAYKSLYTWFSTDPVATPIVSYQTHVQDIGWQDYVSNGVTSGTSAQSKRLEAIRIKLENVVGGIEYKTQVQDIGWMDWVANDTLSGTSAQSKRLEAIQIRLTGAAAEKYDIYYHVHAQNTGWLDWAKNGEPSGTAGFGYRLEAIEIKLVLKGGSAPGPVARTFVDLYAAKPIVDSVSYKTHVQDVGWQTYVSNGAMSGTSAQSKRLEAIQIKLENMAGGIEYRTHVQDYGWMAWAADDSLSGTSGQSKRLEAIQIKLTGTALEKYDVYYCVHAENCGWLDWAKNGESAGTAAFGYRLEAIKVVLVPKGGAAPGSTARAFVQG
ncbi:MAG: hypothetical protein WCG21_03565 [Eubacteriales bacterium]